MKKNQIFLSEDLSEDFNFSVVKLSLYLNRRIFVMIIMSQRIKLKVARV